MIYFLIFSNVILNVLGQYLFKRGLNLFGGLDSTGLIPFFVNIFTSPYVIAGLFSYGFSLLVWFVLLSKVDLSFAYPSIALSYVLIVLISWYFLGESVSAIRLLGVAFIIVGTYFVFRS